MDKNLKKLLLQMIVGLFLYEILLVLIYFFIHRYINCDFLSLFFGTLVGFSVAILILIDIAYISEDIMRSRDFKYARNKTIIKAVIRKVILAALVIIFWRSKYINIFAMIIAIFGIKFATYAVPFIKKIIK